MTCWICGRPERTGLRRLRGRLLRPFGKSRAGVVYHVCNDSVCKERAAEALDFVGGSLV